MSEENRIDGDDQEEEEDEIVEIDDGDIMEFVELNDAAAEENPNSSDEDDGEAADTDAIFLLTCAQTDDVKDIFSVDCAHRLVATGGEDDHMQLYDLSSTDTPKLRFSLAHKESVTFVRFNATGTLLASGDMSGRIAIIDVASGTVRLELDEVAELEWLLWHAKLDILFAGGRDGLLWMWLIANGQAKVYAATDSACTIGTLLVDGRRLLAGYENGSIRLWHLKDGSHMDVAHHQHRSAITCVDTHKSLSVAAAGAANGYITLFRSDTAAMLHTIDNDNALSSVETIAFNPTQHWLAAGFNTGTLTLWDVNTCAARSTITAPGAIVKCQWIDEKMLLAACQDGCVRMWDARDQCQLVREWRGGGSPIFDIAYDAENSCFATACAQGQCRVFDMAGIV